MIKKKNLKTLPKYLTNLSKKINGEYIGFEDLCNNARACSNGYQCDISVQLRYKQPVGPAFAVG